jgi:hypothetical protein
LVYPCVEDDESEGGVMRRRSIMKKLLVLMLVLGMTSVAGAALSLTIDPLVPECSIDGLIESATTIYLFIASDASIAVSLGDAAPSMAGYAMDVATAQSYGIPIPGAYPNGDAYVMAAAPGEDYLTGTYLAGAGAAGDNVLVGWFDEVGGYGEIGAGVLVPEPMTIALLGLGGLFLRRRR